MSIRTDTSFADRVTAFVHNHDDIPAFQATFIVFTFLAAAFLNLGVFLLLIGLHIAMDIAKYRFGKQYSLSQSIGCSLTESSSDIALFVVALTFIAAFQHSYAVIGVSGVLRAALTIGLAAGTVIPKYRIVEDFEDIAFHLQRHVHTAHVKPGSLTFVQRCAIGVIILCICALIVCSSQIQWTRLIETQLIPWKW